MKKQREPKAPREHTQVGDYKPRITVGSKFVKKANMTIEYENYNKKGSTDKQNWI